jgi:hypothetical protein
LQTADSNGENIKNARSEGFDIFLRRLDGRCGLNRAMVDMVITGFELRGYSLIGT